MSIDWPPSGQLWYACNGPLPWAVHERSPLWCHLGFHWVQLGESMEEPFGQPSSKTSTGYEGIFGQSWLVGGPVGCPVQLGLVESLRGLQPPVGMTTSLDGCCQETSTRDTANKCSLELCASIVLLFLDGCSEWYVSVVFLTGQVLGNWKA